MKTTSELMATIAECHAKVSPMIADEQWVDSDGNIYQIDRSPINWAAVVKARRKGEKENDKKYNVDGRVR